MLSELLDAARADKVLWVPDLRERFLQDPGARPMVLRLTLHSGEQRDYPCAIPRWENEAERAFAAEFLYASVYNILAACSGRELRLFFDLADQELAALWESLDPVFQVHEKARRGYGKVVNIADRIAGSCGGPAFSFAREDIKAHVPLPERGRKEPAPLSEKLRALKKEAAGRALCGVDVGGTDIKLAASIGDRLLCTKEYDWNPAACATAEEITGPILLLARLMRACVAAERALLPVSVSAGLEAALEKDAPDGLIRAVVQEAEDCLGPAVDVLDGVGLSFPDVVIADRILGGETPKTDGMRRNEALDYETEFKKLSGLKEALLKLCRAGGRVRITNDGSMAAFTAAMELGARRGRGGGGAAKGRRGPQSRHRSWHRLSDAGGNDPRPAHGDVRPHPRSRKPGLPRLPTGGSAQHAQSELGPARGAALHGPGRGLPPRLEAKLPPDGRLYAGGRGSSHRPDGASGPPQALP